MNSRSLIAAALLLAALTPAMAGGIEIDGKVAAMDLADRANPAPFMPARVDVVFPEGGVEGLEAPEGVEAPQFGTVTFGEKTWNLVLAKSAAEKPGADVLGLDLDGDGKIGDGERFSLEVSQRQMRGGATVVSGVNLTLDLTVGGKTAHLGFVHSLMPERPMRAQFLLRGYLEGSFKQGETELMVYVMDGDGDGVYGGEKDSWLLQPAGPRGRPANAFGMSSLAEGRFHDGFNYRLALTGGTKMVVEAVAAEGPDANDLAAARVRVEHIWAERFDQEREGFIAARGLDTARAKAETPIAWRYVTVDQAKAMAKKEGKALFIDVMAFWCVWCYRMDYYTYPDAEVAKLMNEKFIPVKIIQEQDEAGDYQALMAELGARGIPAMGIWAPDGTKVETIGGWSKPEDFLTKLNGALAKIESE